MIARLSKLGLDSQLGAKLESRVNMRLLGALTVNYNYVAVNQDFKWGCVMDRYYYISDDLDDLEAVERELESRGISTPQIHVLSENDEEVEAHHLNEVHAFMKTDVVHATLKGAGFGVGAALFVLGFAYWSDYPQQITWTPFVFLAIVLLGFCTWEGGFLGIQMPNSRFRHFQEALRTGKHILLVDVKAGQLSALQQVLNNHTRLISAGKGASSPQWIIAWQDKFRKFVRWAP